MRHKNGSGPVKFSTKLEALALPDVSWGSSIAYTTSNADERLNGFKIRVKASKYKQLYPDIVKNKYYVSAISLKCYGDGSSKPRSMESSMIGWGAIKDQIAPLKQQHDQWKHQRKILKKQKKNVSDAGPEPLKVKDPEHGVQVLAIEFWSIMYINFGGTAKWSEIRKITNIEWKRLRKGVRKPHPQSNPYVTGFRTYCQWVTFYKFRRDWDCLNGPYAKKNPPKATQEQLKKEPLVIEYRAQGCLRLSADEVYFIIDTFDSYDEMRKGLWKLFGPYKYVL